MKNESASSGTGSNQHLSSAGTRYVSTELDEGSLYPEQLQELHGRSPSNLLSQGARPSQQIGPVPAEPSPKMSDNNAGESSDRGDERRKKLTKKQAQELEEIFQADHSGAPGRRAAIARQFGVSQQQIATWFQNRRARERNRELHQDFETVQKCLKAAFEENQALRKELDELRAEHALCSSREDAPGPAAPPPPPAPLDNLLAAPDPKLYRHFSPPLTLSLPQKRPTRSVSEPALPKRARLPPSEPTAFSGPPLQAPLTVPDYSLSSDLRFGGDLFGSFASAPPPMPLVSAPLPTTTSPLGGLTLDEAFRDLLRADPLAATAMGGPAFSAQGFGGSADPFGLLAGGGGRSIRPPSPFGMPGGMPHFDGAVSGGMSFQTDSQLQDLAPDMDATSQALSQEDFNLPPWWDK